METTTSTTVASDLKATSSAAYIKEIPLVPRRLVVVTRGRARLMLVFGMMLPLLWEGPTTSSLPSCWRIWILFLPMSWWGVISISSSRYTLELYPCHHNLFLIVISVLSLIVVVFLLKVLGEAVHLTTKYLTSEKKVVMANSKVNALELRVQLWGRSS